MEQQGMSFPDAVQYLADRAGMTVPHEKGRIEAPEIRAERKKKQQTLEETLQACADFYRHQLQINPPARQYLDGRGLNAEIIGHYGLGYAPDGWQPLAQVFQPYPNNALTECGQVIHNEEQNRYYDRFRHRIMFPIRDQQGRVIGFGGRVLDDSKPKYLNSPDTPLFDKGRNLYGLYEARNAVRDAGRILVVEGYMDVVALAQFGIPYAVASLGTSTTGEHIKILMRQSDEIYFCFDGDAAGRKAAWRALENALPQLKDGKSLNFLFLPPEHDPDSYIRAHGKTQFEDALIHQSKPLSEYFWQALSDGLNLATQEGKSRLLKTAAPLLAQITAPALGFLLKQRLAELVGIDPADLAVLLGQETPPRRVQAKSYKLPRETRRQPAMLTLAQRQIRSLLSNPAWAVHVRLPEYVVLEGDTACLANIADFILSGNTPPDHARIWEHFRDTDTGNVLQQIYQAGGLDDGEDGGEENETAFSDGMGKLIKEFRHAQLEALKRKTVEGGLNDAEKKLLLSLLAEK